MTPDPLKKKTHMHLYASIKKTKKDSFTENLLIKCQLGNAKEHIEYEPTDVNIKYTKKPMVKPY